MHSLEYVCPPFALFARNRLSVAFDICLGRDDQGQERVLKNEEGAGQGGPTAPPSYGMSLLPLKWAADREVHRDVEEELTKHFCSAFFADDGGAVGKLEALAVWLSAVQRAGLNVGYFLQMTKCTLFVKPEHLDKARALFAPFPNLKFLVADDSEEAGVTVLGTPLGSVAYQKKILREKCEEWQGLLTKVIPFARACPQAAYIFFTRLLAPKWTFLSRTVSPELVSAALAPLTPLVRLFAAIIVRGEGNSLSELFSNQFELLSCFPVRHSGIGVSIPAKAAPEFYESASRSVEVLTDLILNNFHHPEMYNKKEELRRRRRLKAEREAKLTNDRDATIQLLLDTKQKSRAVQNCDQNALSHLLTCRRVAENGRELSRREWLDMVALRMGLPITDLPAKCICGADNSVEHALVCRRGHHQVRLHDDIRDFLASICVAAGLVVETEPQFAPVPPDVPLPRGTIRADGARSDLLIWGLDPQGQSNFVDVRVSFPHCPTHEGRSPSQIHAANEKEKLRKYGARANFQQSHYTTVSVLVTGHVNGQGHGLLKALGHKMSRKTHAPGEVGYLTSYNAYITSFRSRLAFIIARGASMCLRADRDVNRRYAARLQQQLDLSAGYADLFMGMDLLAES